MKHGHRKPRVSEIHWEGSVELHALTGPHTRNLSPTVFHNDHLNCVNVVLLVANYFSDGKYRPNISRLNSGLRRIRSLVNEPFCPSATLRSESVLG